MCSHPRTGDATDEKIAEEKSREIPSVEFFATKSRTSSEDGYTCDFRHALATRQFQKNGITIASKKLRLTKGPSLSTNKGDAPRSIIFVSTIVKLLTHGS